MTSYSSSLADFGWNDHFHAQLSETDIAQGSGGLVPARVMTVHRDRIQVAGPGIDMLVPPYNDGDGAEATATVGDWLLIDVAAGRARHLLRRTSLFKRRAAGTGRKLQLIAANVDTLFIVSSCNLDFNLARLERFLALATDAGVGPVLVLTKSDMVDDPERFAREARQLMPALVTEFVDARDPRQVAGLSRWCRLGQTVALVGSSGVGKSTLINTLTGLAQDAESAVRTGSIREDDAKGRHTTSGRTLHRLPLGGWLVDTPGMRELQLTDAKVGVEELFGDIVALTGECRFSDCQHGVEPGCAIAAALAAGTLDPARLARWRKLEAEDLHNSQSLAERRARGRAFGKMAREVIKKKRGLE